MIQKATGVWVRPEASKIHLGSYQSFLVSVFTLTLAGDDVILSLGRVIYDSDCAFAKYHLSRYRSDRMYP
jgi:hypothetical protein